MKRKRRTFTAEAKAKIALEAMKGEKTVNASAAFEKGKRAAEQAEHSERKQEKLYKKIGELSMDVEFLKKSCRKLGIELLPEYDD